MGGDLRIGQSTDWGCSQDPFFSRAVGSIQLYRVGVKGCHVRELLTGSVRRAYVDCHRKRT
jgi:hypothetical protein